jgi:hypothetical protein
MSVNWEAFMRALRTFVQGLLVTGLTAAWEAAQAAVAANGFNAKLVLTAAVFAFVTAVVTYIYNLISPRETPSKTE